jgi:toxin ParE1/3/4
MTRYRVVPRRRAEQDINDAVDRYFADGGVDPALQSVDAIESAFNHLAAHPGSGSPRYAVELDLPNLRYGSSRSFLI